MTPAETTQRPAWLGPLVAGLQDPGRRAAAVAVRGARGGRPAAVLILIGDGPAGPEILFVERAATLRTHAGQIAFPGGAADPGDRDVAATAVREAVEETGVDPRGVEIIGALPPAHVAVSGFDVTAVLGWWRDPSPVGPADPAEVASVEVVSVADLTDPAHRARVRHPSGYTGPAFEVAGHLVWGLTAHFLDAVLDLAGWSRTWDPDRTVEIPARYLTDRLGSGGADAH